MRLIMKKTAPFGENRLAAGTALPSNVVAESAETTLKAGSILWAMLSSFM
jgi:hypothetical protein